MGIEVGLFGLILLALDIYAILRIVNSAASTGAKTIWIVVILLLPLLGLVAWALAGPK